MTKYEDVIHEIQDSIEEEKKEIKISKLRMKETEDAEAKELLSNAIQAHTLSLITLQKLLKRVTKNTKYKN